LKIIIGGIVALVLVAAIVIGVLKLASHRPSGGVVPIEKREVRDATDVRRALEVAADDLNKHPPGSPKDVVRFDRAFAGPGAHITYYYSVPNYSSGQIHATELRKVAEPFLRRELCADKALKDSLNFGAVFVYVIRGNDGSEVLRLELSKGVCGL
jgi:hypothetical protein